MSENPTPTSEPATGPVATAPPPPLPVREEPRRSRATTAAAWVGVVAGVVFIVAAIFFSGFVLGTHSGGHRGLDGPRGDHGFAVFRGGPPPMFPMSPGGQFDRPGPGFGPGAGPGGPRFEPPQPPNSPQSPGATPPPPRP